MPSALDPGAAQCWAKLKSQVTHEHNISLKLDSHKAASLKPLKIIVQLFFRVYCHFSMAWQGGKEIFQLNNSIEETIISRLTYGCQL